MKKFLTLILLALTTICASAQVTEVWKDGIMQANVTGADSIRITNNTMTRAEIKAWAQAHVDSLASVAWRRLLAENSVICDPDETREVFRSIGYNGRNVFQYNSGCDVVNTAVRDSLVAQAKKNGNRKVVVLAGHSCAGKSSSVEKCADVKEMVSNAGIVLDGVWSDRDELKQVLEDLKNEGLDDQSVVLVYRGAEKSFKKASQRFIEEGRVIGLRYFIGDRLFTKFQGYVADFMESSLADMGVKRYYLDNSGDAVAMVDAEAAKNWDYTLSDEQKQRMAYNLYLYIYENKDLLSYRDAWAMFYDE